jgi:hypothetical protein
MLRDTLVYRVSTAFLVGLMYCILPTSTMAQSGLVLDLDGYPMIVTISANPVSDACPDSPPNEVENEIGCTPSQLDTDLDGINNADDICDHSGPAVMVNEIGCTPDQMAYLNSQDEDADGVPDYLDACWGTSAGQQPDIDSEGCHPDQRDADSDGVPDYQDAYPLQHNTMCPAN